METRRRGGQAANKIKIRLEWSHKFIPLPNAWQSSHTYTTRADAGH